MRSLWDKLPIVEKEPTIPEILGFRSGKPRGQIGMLLPNGTVIREEVEPPVKPLPVLPALGVKLADPEIAMQRVEPRKASVREILIAFGVHESAFRALEGR